MIHDYFSLFYSVLRVGLLLRLLQLPLLLDRSKAVGKQGSHIYPKTHSPWIYPKTPFSWLWSVFHVFHDITSESSASHNRLFTPEQDLDPCVANHRNDETFYYGHGT